MVFEPLVERQQHDLDGQTEGSRFGHLRRGQSFTGVQSPLRQQIITVRQLKSNMCAGNMCYYKDGDCPGKMTALQACGGTNIPVHVSTSPANHV